MTYTVEIDRYDPTDPRLGRHVHHDSRSRSFAAPEGGASAWKSVHHERFIPVLDQGQVGSCTGNAAAGCLGTAAFWGDATQKVLSATDGASDEAEAVKLYSAATELDSYQGSYPPDDTGSDGLSVAKACMKAGLISGYTHAFSLDALLTALSKQPVIVGTQWTKDMFDPDASGQLHPTGAVAGGHEYVLDELDAEGERIWMTNSWAETWGQQGRAWFSFDDFQTLLGQQGDCTIFTPIDQPPPEPTRDEEIEGLLKQARSDNKAVATALKQALAKLAEPSTN